MSDMDEDDAHGDGAADTLLYDYFKHLTSLCILSLGGVLALIPEAKGLKPPVLILVLVVIGLAGLLSFSATSEIVRARFLARSIGKSVNVCRIGAPMLLSIGLGMFLYLFTRTL